MSGPATPRQSDRLTPLFAGWLAAAMLPVAMAQSEPGDNNTCDLPGEVPDMILTDLFDVHRWGTIDGITASGRA